MTTNIRTERLLNDLIEQANARSTDRPQISWATLDSVLLLVASLRAEVAALTAKADSLTTLAWKLGYDAGQNVPAATITDLRAEVAALTEQTISDLEQYRDGLIAEYGPAWGSSGDCLTLNGAIALVKYAKPSPTISPEGAQDQ